MKALAIRQPWAHAIVHLGKRVENRDWSGCSYRGPVLIHASKGCTRAEYLEACESIVCDIKAASWFGGDGKPPKMPTLPEMSRGGIVGRARIIDVILGHEHEHHPAAKSPWYVGGFALLLADVEPLPFIPYKGRRGFFDVPDQLVESTIAEAEQRRVEEHLRELDEEAGFAGPHSLARPYHAHLNVCARCASRPFDLCPDGAELLHQAAT